MGVVYSPHSVMQSPYMRSFFSMSAWMSRGWAISDAVGGYKVSNSACANRKGTRASYVGAVRDLSSVRVAVSCSNSECMVLRSYRPRTGNFWCDPPHIH